MDIFKPIYDKSHISCYEWIKTSNWVVPVICISIMTGAILGYIIAKILNVAIIQIMC